MKAVVIQRYGSSDVLEYASNHPEPDKLHSNQVVIKVNAAGINPLDIKIRKGDLRLISRSKFPMLLGNDACGVIVKCGSRVYNYKVGDHVYCMVDTNKRFSLSGFAKGGSYAEYCVTREDTISLKPDSLADEEAASLPLCCLTAYQALVYKARIKSGDTVLINGASGGVGVYAVQIAKAFGANITAICSSRNREFIKSLGADTAIDYKEKGITQLSDKFDIIYDIVANTSYTQCKHILNKKGVFISNIASLTSIITTYLFPLLGVFGFGKRSTFAWVKPSGKDLSLISQMVNDGQIRPIIDQIYSLNEIRQAHEYSETGRVKGKLVIKI